MLDLIYDFMMINGDPIARTSKECMGYLQNNAGFSYNASRGILGKAVFQGFITCIMVTDDVKIYSI